jgi:cyclopropane fatty-acyl-phospholipid synthase-like methyltransferase
MKKDDLIELEYQKMLNDPRPMDFSHQSGLKSLLRRFPLKEGSTVLELGSGPCSILIGQSKVLVHAIEKNQQALDYAKKNHSADHINYYLQDVCSLEAPNDHSLERSFDHIVDAHCLHLITDPIERRHTFDTLYQKLSPGGTFYAEMMIRSPMMKFVEPFSYSDIGNVLFYNDVPYAHIPDCRHLENEILSHGFQIFYFYVQSGKKFVIDKRTFSDGDIGNCDCIQMILKRPE